MSLINRYSITENGSMIFTGNTLGLTTTGGGSDIGAYTTLNNASQVPGFPVGTTLNWQDNGSSAQFSLPPGSTILYAELQWGGNYGGNVSGATLDTPITFTSPSGTYTISPDPVTSQAGPIFYSRSQDVTSILQSDGAGFYSVEGVPAQINSAVAAAGWTLGIIYENPSLPIQNMTIYSGVQEIGAAAPPVDFNISGFLTPSAGAVAGRVLVSAMEGDYGTSGDQMLLGPNTGTLLALSGPNNLVNNFFASQINDGDSESATVGQLDTTGTFGTINPPALPSRWGWDITNVLSNNFVNDQTAAVVRITSTGDGYAVPLLGIQLDAVPIDFGDAPDSNPATQGPGNYSSLQAGGGPYHIIDPNLRLGNQVTADADAQQNILADGDDQIRNIPDDGTTLPLTPMAYNAASYSIDVTVNNNTGVDANVYAWLDFNQDGIFQTNEGTTVVVPTSVVSQNVTLTFNRPAPLPTPIGNTYIRVRLTTDTLINTGGPTDEDTRSLGMANDGEVEDYFLPITSEPFNCEPYGYRVAIPGGGANSNLVKINLVTGEEEIIKPDIGITVNSIGYNTLDNLIYGTVVPSGELFVIDSLGNVGIYGQIPNLPSGPYAIGAIDGNGHLFVTTGSNNYYVIDVDTTSPTFGQLLDPTAGFILDTAPFGTPLSQPLGGFVGDWTFNSVDGNLYGAQNDGDIVRVDPFTGQVTVLTTTGVGSADFFGAAYSVADGFIYVSGNNTGEVYRVTIDGNNATGELFVVGGTSAGNDGAACLNAQLLIDFGDAPNNYKTLLVDNGPRHGIVNALTLGSQVTAENDAYASVDALGDDQVLGVQDDGLISPRTIPLNSTTYTIRVQYTNDIGTNANIYAWIDFNKDGIFQLQEAATVVSVSSSATNPRIVTLNFTVPPTNNLVDGDITYLRIRITSNNLINTNILPTQEDTRSFGAASDGEVEDYLLNVFNVDFGDAPDTSSGNAPNDYSTLYENNGPMHNIINNLTLGVGITSEPNAYQSPQALGDDTVLLIQDDGVKYTVKPIVLGDKNYSINVTYVNDTGSTAYLYGWVDFNKNGIFELEESLPLTLIPSTSNAEQQVNATFTIPSSSTLVAGDYTFMRLRITTSPLNNINVLQTAEDTRSLGLAQDGEVEDYQVQATSLSVNGVVWYDTNCNGIRETGEPLASGVTVELYDVNNPNNPIAVTSTDLNGVYQFLNVQTGEYYVVVKSPSGYSFTLPNVGTNDTVDSDVDSTTGKTANFNLSVDNQIESLDAGLCTCYKIAGQTFFDCKNNGLINSKTPYLYGVTVILFNDAGKQIASTTTDCDGYYEFDCEKSGDYTVQFISPPNMINTTQNLTYYGSKPVTATGIANVTISTQDVLNIFAGFTGSLGIKLRYCLTCNSNYENCCICQNLK